MGREQDTAPGSAQEIDASERHLISFRRASLREQGDFEHFRATRSIVTAARRWRKVANERVKAVGQTMARWETLFLVAYSDAELTQGELARLIDVEGPTMVRMLDSLARDGLIERKQSDTDRRVTLNRITSRGQEVITEIMDITNALRNDLLKDIPHDKLDVMAETLGMILKRLDEMR
jgi:MarR family transcriptional regulator for hemolysin